MKFQFWLENNSYEIINIVSSFLFSFNFSYPYKSDKKFIIIYPSFSMNRVKFLAFRFDFYDCAKANFFVEVETSCSPFSFKKCCTFKRGIGPLHSLVGVEASKCLYHSLLLGTYFLHTNRQHVNLSTLC